MGSRTRTPRRPQGIDWFSQSALRATSIAVVGAGAVGNEVVKNLVLLGVGQVDVYDDGAVLPADVAQSVFLRGSDVGSSKALAVVRRASVLDRDVHLRAIEGNFRDLVGLAAMREYRAVISAVDRFDTRLQLNELCLVAGVNFVDAASDSRTASVESFPFAEHWGGACYECRLPEAARTLLAVRRAAGGLRLRSEEALRAPTTAITASVAGALAASTALRMGATSLRPGPVRVVIDTVGDTHRVVRLERNESCARCAALHQSPTVVRARNRWSLAPEVAALGPDSLRQELQLSDALIVDYECASCGRPEQAAGYLNRRAADFDDSIRACPRCSATSVRIDVRDRFDVRELVERFGDGAVPAKFALAHMGDRTICFDLGA